MNVRAPAGVAFDRRAIGRGAVVGLCVIAPASVVDLMLSAVDGLDEGVWVLALFGVILFAFTAAGYRGAKAAPRFPYSHGALSGLAAFGLWLPLRIVTRALVGEQLIGRAGDNAIEVFEAVAAAGLFAMSFGILGGLIASRRHREQP